MMTFLNDAFLPVDLRCPEKNVFIILLASSSCAEL